MTTKSEKCWELLKQFTPNGTQTLSKGVTRYVDGIYPPVLYRGKGGRVWDEDGNSYLDLIAGLGAITVGYCNPVINKVVHEQLELGISFSLPNKLEYLVSEQFTKILPYTDMWKFTKTGSDATSMAVKCARAYTGRNVVIALGYHGWHDWYSILNDKKAGIPDHIKWDVRKGTYNKLDFLNDLDSYSYAAVIMEPMVFDKPEPGFFQKLQDKCRETDTLLIFDEVVTGGRFEKFAAQNYFGIEPDITVFSKGIANGFPLAAVGGRKSIMQTFERDDFFASTTFGGECASLSACLKTVEILNENIPKMIYNGSRIQTTFNDVFRNYGAICKGYPTRLTFDFPSKEHKALFMQEMCIAGVLTGYSNCVMADHTDAEIDEIVTAIKFTSTIVKENWHNPAAKLKGNVPIEVFRLR